MLDSVYYIFDVDLDGPVVLMIPYIFRTGICTFDPGFTSTGMQQ